MIRVLFRFLIDRILFSVLSDRVFFAFSEIGSSDLGSAEIDSSLDQCSFSAMSLFSYQIVLLLFYRFSKTISSTCFDNFRKTDSEKKEEINQGS